MSSVLHMLEKPINLISMYPLSILFFFFLFLLYKWLSIHSTQIKNLPPSPPKLPILGHIHKLGIYPHRSLQSLSKKYGDLMFIYFGYKPTIIISSASVAEKILKTHDSIFSNRPKSSIFDRLIYNSRDVAAAPYGEYWRQMRSIVVLQLLSNKRVRSFRTVREEEISLMIEKIVKKSTLSVVNMSDMFMKLTNDVICRVAFGRKYSGEICGINFKELLDDFSELVGVVNVGDFIPWLSWISRLNGLDGKLDKVAKRFDLLLEHILEEHLKPIINRQGEYSESENGKEAKDFVDVLLKAQRENTAGFPIERDSIKALVLDAFVAGTHTTSAVLEWAMTELLRNPTIMEELQKEIRGIIGCKEYVSEDDLEKMKYLKAVIKETVRLHPPVPLLAPRESTQEVKINGYDIPARTLVIINAWAIQQDPITWNDPELFHPERFLNSSIDFKGQDFQLIPFGGGRRICPGIQFAMANNELVIANLMHKFNWALPDGVKGETLDMSEKTGFTLSRKTPLLAVVTPHVNK